MTNITVNQLLELAATVNLELNFYDEAHQISEDTCEQDIKDGNTKYNWGEAVVEYWYPENEGTLRIKCTLPDTIPLKLATIVVSLGDIAESLSLIRDNACEPLKFDNLLTELYAWRNKLEGPSKNTHLIAVDPAIMKAAILAGFNEFIIDIMVAAESERETDTCSVNILDSECIATLALTR